MGILNLTPDSFSDGGEFITESTVLKRSAEIIQEGAEIIDIGGMSSRPGASIIAQDEELSRIIPYIEKIRQEFPEIILSIDTIRSKVAQEALDRDVSIINDISFGSFDSNLPLVAINNNAPYIGMHMNGMPNNMQVNPHYPEGVVLSILKYFTQKTNEFSKKGLVDIIIDPGFGFGKSIVHNYDLLKSIETFHILNRPILIGLSRKSMIWKLLETTPKETLNASSALHLQALLKGVNILRVHDVSAAKQIIKLYEVMAS